MTQNQPGAMPSRRSIRPLAVGYLVWHVASMLVLIGLLALTTLAYAGIFPAAGELPAQARVFGLALPIWAVIVPLWVTFCFCAVAGALFGLGAWHASCCPEGLGRTVVLGRVMSGLCALDVLMTLLSADAVSLLASVVSLLLTGALAIEVRRVERSYREELDEESVPHTPKRSFVVASVAGAQREGELEASQRQTFRLVSGYATIMLVWGGLRTLSGLSTLLQVPWGGAGPEFWGALVVGLAVSVSGGYLMFVGRLGKRALFGGSTNHRFLVAGFVGLVVSLVALAAFAWLAQGAYEGAGADLFTLALDAALYAAGLHYAYRLGRDFAA